MINPLRSSGAGDVARHTQVRSSRTGTPNDAGRAGAAQSAAGGGVVHAPGRARALELARQVDTAAPSDPQRLEAAQQRLESGFYHSPEGVDALTEHLVGA